MKKLFTFVASWLIIQGCASFDEALNRSASTGNFNPLTLPTVNVEKYKEDKQFCFKQVQSQTHGSMNQNYSIIQFRACLIQKGYVLLS